ncbi:MAG: Brp/Blh family beta-carotene 15,15'-dioxygenase [Planctomycetota bacterium]
MRNGWWPTTVCVGATALVFLLPGVAERLIAWPWLVALFVIGMPHGALDYVVHQRLRASAGQRTGLATFAGYLAVMGVSALILWAAPLAAVLLFFVLTAWHFGLADVLHAAGDRADDATQRRAATHALALCRGGLVLSVPFAAAPAAAWEPFAMLGAPAMDAQAAQVAAVVAVSTTAALLLGLVVLVNRNPAGFAEDAADRFLAETTAAAVMLFLVPPLLAVGVYFLGVHAAKHTHRLTRPPCSELLRTGGGEEPAWRRWVRAHRLGLWLLVPALLTVGVWARFLDAPWTMRLAAASIGFYIISTAPHHHLGLRLPVEADAPKAQTSS